MGRDFVVGLIFLVALALLIFGAITVRGVPTGAELYELRVRFDSVSGLKKGDDVRIRGFEMGEVADIRYEPSGIDVQISLYQKIAPRDGYSFMVLPASALGGNYIDYVPGTGPEVSTQDLVGSGSTDLLVEAGRFLRENGSRLTTVLDDVSALTKSLREGEGVLGRVIMNKELADKFSTIVDNIEEITRKANERDNLLGVIVDDEEVARQIREMVADAREIVARAEDEASGLSVLLSSETGDRFRSIAAEVDEMIVGLKEEKSVLGKLIYNEALGRRLVEIADNVASATNALANPTGTIGRLLHSDELYVEIRRAVQYFRDGAEDVREQAPVNTFLNALFSAF